MKRSRLFLVGVTAVSLPCIRGFVFTRRRRLVAGRPLSALGSTRNAKEQRISPTDEAAPLSSSLPWFTNSTSGVSLPLSAKTIPGISNDGDDVVQASADKNMMFVFLWLIACLSALDRVAMSVAVLPMSAELGWTDTTKGAISSLFSVGYGLCIIPAGLLVSSQPPTLVLAAGVGLWSVATMATPSAALVPGMLALLMVRAAVGAGETVIIPALQTLLINWSSPQEKSRALATVYSGFHVGTISAYLISPIIMAEVGWRGLFELYGAVGLVILVPWLLYAKNRPAPASPVEPVVEVDTRQAFAHQPLSNQVTAAIQEAPWQEFVQSRGAWAMLLAHCAKNWGLYNSLAWTPTFYAECYHMDARDSALFSILPSILGAIGGVTAGTVADYLLRTQGDDESTEARTNLRKGFQAIAFLGPALALGALAHDIPDEPKLAQIFLMVSVGLQAANVAGFEAGTQEKAGEKWAGLLYSLTSLPAVIVGTTGVYVTGRILDATGQDWSIVFGLNACINVLGAIAFVSMYDSKREFR